MARPRSDIGPRILAAARARFLHDGVDGASLRDIARDAGTSLGMIHYYFAAKDELFLAVVEEAYARFSADIVAIMARDGTLEERVRALCGRVAAASDAEFDILRLVVREVLVSSERRRMLMARFLRGHVPPVLGALVAARADGEIASEHPVPAAALALLAVAIFPQLLRRAIGDERAPLPLPPPAELADGLATVLFEGLRPRTGGKRRRG
jgi:AcrR family transcriptional regulator